MLCRLKFSKSLGADKVRSLIVHPLSKQASQPAQLAADYRAVVTITYSKVLLTESAEGFHVFWFCIQLQAARRRRRRIAALRFLYTSTESN